MAVRFSTCVSLLLAVAAMPLAAQNPDSTASTRISADSMAALGISPPDSSDLVGKVRRALWDYYWIAKERGGRIRNPPFPPTDAQILLNRDPVGEVACLFDRSEYCVRGSTSLYSDFPDRDRLPAVGLVHDAGSASDPGAFALAPRVSVTQQVAVTEPSGSATLPDPVEPIGRMHCHANLGAYCMQGDWDTAPCLLTDFSCHPKTPEMNLDDRRRMMTIVDSAVALLPGDDFVVGQAVYANMKFQRPIQATIALRNCQATTWWCRALEGWVHHRSGLIVASEAAFEEALRLMPEELRCEWTDHRVLLEYGDRDEYRDLACGPDRDAANEQLWWVSDPLFRQPGNDRFTEQMSRATASIVHDQIIRILHGRHGSPHRDLVDRFGFEDSYQFPSFTRSIRSRGALTHPAAPFSFVPDIEAIDDPLHTSSSSWAVGYQDQFEGYAWWGRFFVELPHQVAYFQRGDSALAVVATDVERQPVLDPWAYTVGLYVARGPGVEERMEIDPERRPTYRWALPVSSAPHLFSVEAIVPEQGAARARFGQAPPFLEHEDDVAVSDMLVYRPSGFEPRSAEDALALAYGRTQLRADEDLALYFEVYGAEADELTAFRLEVVEERSGVLSAVGGALGLSGPDGLRLEWTAPAEPDEDLVWPNALDIDLSELETGEYTFELQVSVGGLRPRVVRRTVFIVEE